MTTDATLGRVSRPRGVLTEDERYEIDYWREHKELAERTYRRYVVAALHRGASFAEVSKATGLSTNTLQRWKREAWSRPCTCDKPSEYLYGDTNGFHCQKCNGLVSPEPRTR